MSDALAFAARYAPQAMALVVAAIFLDSLRYKFTNHPKTQEIFSRLDAWSASLGARGLFARTGLFSQYVIGAAELVASTLLLVGAFYPPAGLLLPLGALLGLAVMSGAISFHLFTPLGIDPNKDGGGLFRAACLVWVLCLVLISLHAGDLILLGRRAASLLAPS
jgi:uncharacterized membrane protein YkgB